MGKSLRPSLDMSHTQLSPLQVNSQTKEPFIRVRGHEHIIVTPPRLSDAPFLPPIFNDPRVHEWLSGPPYPYLPAHAESWLLTTKAASDRILRELEAAEGEAALKIVDDCPVRTLREVKDDGTEIFLGDIGFLRCPYMELAGTQGVNWEQKERLTDENARRPPGDPDIIWSVGDYLKPSHHGQGIMSAAIETLLHEWAIPRMRVRRILVTALKGNKGSVRVFEKNGFILRETLDSHLKTKGETRGSHVLEWKLDAE